MTDHTPFSFAFITDCQIGMNSPHGLHGPASDKERLDRAVAWINESDIDFVVLGGDQINRREGETTADEIAVLRECLSKLSVPYYGVIGNHEQGDPEQPWAYIDAGLPVRFSLTHKSLHMVGLNASWLRGDFGVRYVQQEIQFLATELARAPGTCRHRFVVMHWPLFSREPDEEDTYWNMPNRRSLIELFAEHQVECVLCGHWQQDIDACWRGVNLVTSVGTALPLQYPEELAFKVVTVFKDGWSARRVSVAAE